MNNKGNSSVNRHNDLKVSLEIYPAKEAFSKSSKDSDDIWGWDHFPFVGGFVSCTLLLPLILAASSFACHLFSNLAGYNIVIGETGKWSDLGKNDIKDLNPIPVLMLLYIATLALTLMILLSSFLSKSKVLYKTIGCVSFMLLLAAIAFSSHICLILNKNLVEILKASNISEEDLVVSTNYYENNKLTHSTTTAFSFERDIHGITQVSGPGINLLIASLFFTVVTFLLHSFGLILCCDTEEEGKVAGSDSIDQQEQETASNISFHHPSDYDNVI